MLLQLEQECLEVYRRKVDNASHARARLHQALADAESELAALLSALGDRPGAVARVSLLRMSVPGTGLPIVVLLAASTAGGHLRTLTFAVLFSGFCRRRKEVVP